MSNTRKFYVVWRGRKTGVFESWKQCEEQIHSFPSAAYKSFPTRSEAEEAFRMGASACQAGHRKKEFSTNKHKTGFSGKPVLNSISVDAAWNHVSKYMEYRGVLTDTGEELFRKGPFADATNNVGEFLAIVHALALLQKKGKTLPVYSDSRNAIKWVMQKKHASNLKPTPHNAEVFDLLNRAEQWLQQHTVANPVLKWETAHWGENPADFGRK